MSWNRDHLLKQAGIARERAYAPYSQFRVGCALVGADGRIFHGCNVENAAYGPSNCAERTALFSAIAAGERIRTFKALAIIGDAKAPLAPCGICRQVMLELCSPDMPVIMGNLAGACRETTVAALLPDAFSKEDLLP